MNELDKLKKFFSESFDHKTQILVRVAIIGVAIGIVAVAFRKSTEWLEEFLYADYYVREHWYDWLYMPAICAAGGLIAGFLTCKFAPDASGSGIPQVKHALNSSGTIIRLRTAMVKFIGGVVALASGLSLGREGPTVQIGAGLASKISKLLGGKHRKRAIASGAGAGLAAAFNTPIAGVIFVIEELDRNMSSLALGPAIVCSVSAAVTCRLLYGNFFTFHFMSENDLNLIHIPFYIGFGILAAIIGVYFQRSVLWGMTFYETHLKAVPKWAWGAIAGLATGIVGLFIPQALGGGHSTLEGVLAGAYAWSFIPLIFLCKYLLTMIAYGSGVPGGIFAPSLILGALLGSFTGNILHLSLPTLSIDPASFAFVGMGAFFTAISRAPITSIVMLFELTGNYQLVLPLMFACIISNISAERLKQGSIYRDLLERQGISLKEYSSPSYLQRFCVGDAMTTKVDYLLDSTTIKDLEDLFASQDHGGYPVLDSEKKLIGIVTKEDLLKAHSQKIPSTNSITEIMSKNLKVVTQSDNLHTAILRFYEFKIGRLIVVDESDSNILLGIITRSDIINFEANQELDY
jgi:chloride channel protein, CIC family